MRVLVIAIGNPLRGDDGVAQAAATRLAIGQDCEILEVVELTPELAALLPGFGRVIFLDADLRTHEVSVEQLRTDADTAPAGSHMSAPGQIVSLARRLYRFTGEALLCRIPVQLPADGFPFSQCLTAAAAESAARAAEILAACITPARPDSPGCAKAHESAA